MARPPNSWVWEHFRQDTSQPATSTHTSVECQICNKVLRYSSRNGPTNLARHLTRSHSMHPPDSHITRRPFESLSMRENNLHSGAGVTKTLVDSPGTTKQADSMKNSNTFGMTNAVPNGLNTAPHSSISAMSNVDVSTENTSATDSCLIGYHTDGKRIGTGNHASISDSSLTSKSTLSVGNVSSVSNNPNIAISTNFNTPSINPNNSQISPRGNSNNNPSEKHNGAKDNKTTTKQSITPVPSSDSLKAGHNSEMPNQINMKTVRDEINADIKVQRDHNDSNLKNARLGEMSSKNARQITEETQSEISNNKEPETSIFQSPALENRVKRGHSRNHSRSLSGGMFSSLPYSSAGNIARSPNDLASPSIVPHNIKNNAKLDYDQFARNVNLFPIYRMEVGNKNKDRKRKLQKPSSVKTDSSSTSESTANGIVSGVGSPQLPSQQYSSPRNNSMQQVKRTQLAQQQLSPTTLRLSNMTPGAITSFGSHNTPKHYNQIDQQYFSNPQGYLFPLGNVDISSSTKLMNSHMLSNGDDGSNDDDQVQNRNQVNNLSMNAIFNSNINAFGHLDSTNTSNLNEIDAGDIEPVPVLINGLAHTGVVAENTLLSQKQGISKESYESMALMNKAKRLKVSNDGSPHSSKSPTFGIPSNIMIMQSLAGCDISPRRTINRHQRQTSQQLKLRLQLQMQRQQQQQQQLEQLNQLEQLEQFGQLNQMEQINQMNQLSQLNQLNQLSQLNQMNQFNHINQFSQMNQMNQISQISQINQINQMGQLNHMGHSNQVNQIGHQQKLGMQKFVRANPSMVDTTNDVPQVGTFSSSASVAGSSLHELPSKRNDSEEERQVENGMSEFTRIGEGNSTKVINGIDSNIGSVTINMLMDVIRVLQSSILRIEEETIQQRTTIIHLEQNVARGMNEKRGSGSEVPYEVLPWQGDENKLPLLTNISTVFSLSDTQLQSYLSLYGIQDEGEHEATKTTAENIEKTIKQKKGRSGDVTKGYNTTSNNDNGFVGEERITENDGKTKQNDSKQTNKIDKPKASLFRLAKFIGCSDVAKYWDKYLAGGEF